MRWWLLVLHPDHRPAPTTWRSALPVKPPGDASLQRRTPTTPTHPILRRGLSSGNVPNQDHNSVTNRRRSEKCRRKAFDSPQEETAKKEEKHTQPSELHSWVLPKMSFGDNNSHIRTNTGVKTLRQQQIKVDNSVPGE